MTVSNLLSFLHMEYYHTTGIGCISKYFINLMRLNKVRRALKVYYINESHNNLYLYIDFFCVVPKSNVVYRHASNLYIPHFGSVSSTSNPVYWQSNELKPTLDSSFFPLADGMGSISAYAFKHNSQRSKKNKQHG